MAAKVLFVKPEHREILEQYFPSDKEYDGIALVYGEDAQAAVTSAGIDDGEVIDWDFGGLADVYVDIVADTGHPMIESLNSDE